MSQKTPSNAANRDKKSIVTNGQEGRNRSKLLILATIILVAGAAIGYFITSPSSQGPQPAATAAAVQSKTNANEIRYAMAEFSDGRARHYEYNHNGMNIRYFILQSSDGVVRAAFDACDVCWPSGKGYVQEDDTMVCRNCGRRFVSVKINEVQGGCNPAPLARSVEGDQLVIKIGDVVQGQQYFDFKGKI